MKIISWNVNGLIPTLKKGFLDPVLDLFPDLLCLQEIRTNTAPELLAGYHHYYYPAAKSGYAGTAVISKTKPKDVVYGLNGWMEDNDGRLITLEFEEFYLLNVYVPNSQKNLRRKDYRLRFDQALLEKVKSLDKPVILCGDFNAYRSALDVFEENQRIDLEEISDEQADLEMLLDEGELFDVFREQNPDKREYTWWAMRKNRRAVNRGWRIDYFLISETLLPQVQKMLHLRELEGSDHCPLLLEIAL